MSSAGDRKRDYLDNPLNEFSTLNLLNVGTVAASHINVQNNRAVQLVNASNFTPGGTVSVINNSGSMLVSGGGTYTTAGAGAANITLQTAGRGTLAVTGRRCPEVAKTADLPLK